ncbi:MAG: glycosyltransferase family 61 protein [Chlamydiia bacterium]
MGELTLKQRFLSKLRSVPGLYSFLKEFWRWMVKAPVELVRACGIGPRFGAATGFFSALRQVRCGECVGKVLLESQKLPWLPKDSLIQRAGMNQNGRQPWPIFWSMHPKARMVGGSLALINSSKLLMEESVYGEKFRLQDPSYNYLMLPKVELLPGACTSLISFWYEEYYHWFTDVVTRLSLLREFPDETRILVRSPLRSYQRDSLRMLGLLDRVVETSSRHLLLEEYYFSSPVGMTGCTNPYAVRWLREQFLHHRGAAQTPKRFFIKRRGKTRGIINQEEIAEYFLSKGWAAIYPEDLSLADQIAYFHNAEVIVGEHGAAFTNLLWCRPGCRVLELCADNFLNGCYEGISLCSGIDHNFKVFNGNLDNTFSVPKRIVEDFIHDN